MKEHVFTFVFALAAIVGCLTWMVHAAPQDDVPRAPAQKGYAPVNGLNIYYEIHGTGSPLVLLHGGGSTLDTSFGKLIPLLARDHQVIAFEQQGHGRTGDIPDRPFTFEQSADDTDGLLRYLKIDRAEFIGFSNGGTIALQIGLRHPNIVGKLVAISASVKRSAFAPEFWDGMKHATLQSMPAELRNAYLQVAPHPDQLQSFHDKSVQRMLDFKDWPDDVIRSIQAPTLIINGDADVVRPEHAVEMFRLLPHAQLAILPGSDHMTLMDKAEPLAAIIRPFLAANK